MEQDEIDENPEDYDCETCPVRLQLEGLDAENTEAWRLYRRIAARVVVDFQMGGELLRRVTAGWPVEDVLDLITRLSLIHDELNPAPATRGD